MARKSILHAALAGGLALASAVYGVPAFAHGSQEYRGGYRMTASGNGMPGQGMVRPGDGTRGLVKVDLTVDDVRSNFRQWLHGQANPKLKLGSVKADGNNTIVAEIVTKDGTLVDRYRVDRSTGAIWQIE